MPAPVKNTCPKIDDVIKSIKLVTKWAASNSDNYEIDPEDAREDFLQIVKELSDAEYILEDLRSDNDQLRTWGYELEKRIGELEQEVDSLNNQIQELN